MTQDRPDAAELLAIARATLIAEIVPALSGEQRLTGLMVANALGMAEREMAARAPQPNAEAEAAERTLAGRIRTGACDADRGIHDRLLHDAEARVAISNPRYR